MRLQLLWLEAPLLGLVASLPSQRHPKLQGLLIVPDIQLTCRVKDQCRRCVLKVARPERWDS